MNNVRTNATSKQTVQFSVLNDEQIQEIIEASFRILKRTGCLIKNEEALNILKEAGARVEGEHVWIPSHLIEKALLTVPKEITLYNTEGEPQVYLSGRNGRSYFAPGISVQHVVDRHTNEKRLTTYADAYATGLVTEAMPNIDVACGLCYVSDCHHMTADLHEIRALLETTTKPHSLWHSDKGSLETLIKMYATMAGGLDKFLAKPFAFGSAAAATPLSHPDEALEKGLFQWKLGMPSMYGVTTMMGGTAPSTMAGAFALALADGFVGLVLSQLVNPGTPLIMALGTVPFDMVSMEPSLTGPDASLGAAGQAAIFRYLGIPQFSLMGGSHCTVFDQQAAFDMGMGIFSTTLAGAGIGGFAGFLEDGMSSSLEALVYCNEVIDMARHYAQGIEVSAETIAEDVINAVGPTGNFLGEEHTMRHFRERWMAKIAIRDTYENWKLMGGKDMRQRCVEKVDEIIANGPTTNRDPKLLKELDDIIKSYEDTLQF